MVPSTSRASTSTSWTAASERGSGGRSDASARGGVAGGCRGPGAGAGPPPPPLSCVWRWGGWGWRRWRGEAAAPPATTADARPAQGQEDAAAAAAGTPRVAARRGGRAAAAAAPTNAGERDMGTAGKGWGRQQGWKGKEGGGGGQVDWGMRMPTGSDEGSGRREVERGLHQGQVSSVANSSSCRARRGISCQCLLAGAHPSSFMTGPYDTAMGSKRVFVKVTPVGTSVDAVGGTRL